MSTFAGYFFEANALVLILAAIYALLFRHGSDFEFKRKFILAGLLAAILVPMFSFEPPSPLNTSVNYIMSQIPYSMDHPQTIVRSPGLTYPTLSIEWLLITFYAAGSLLLFFLLAGRLIRTAYYLRGCRTFSTKGMQIIEDPTSVNSFSFLRYIVIGNTSHLSDLEKSLIIRHEAVHIQRLHSLDLILIELLKCAFWLNPALYFLKSELRMLHEFQADLETADITNVDAYCQLLAKSSLLSAGYPVTNSFGSMQTMNRIARIRSQRSSLPSWRRVTGIVFLILTLIYASCESPGEFQKSKARLSHLSIHPESNIKLDSIPLSLSLDLADLQKEYPASQFVIIDSSTPEGREKLSKFFKREDVGIFAQTEYFEGAFNENVQWHQYTIIELTDRKLRRRRLPKDENLYSTVDEAARPGSGLATLNRMIHHTLQYPEEAKKNRIEGVVELEFTVGTDGKLSDIQVARSVDEFLDAEAIRVLLQVGRENWDAAIKDEHVVRQRMSIPIEFKL